MVTVFAVLWIIAVASVLIFMGTGFYCILLLSSFGERRILWTALAPFSIAAWALYSLFLHCPFSIKLIESMVIGR